jgi:hypothetical protein
MAPSIKISRTAAARLTRYGGGVPTTQVGKTVVDAVVFELGDARGRRRLLAGPLLIIVVIEPAPAS